MLGILNGNLIIWILFALSYTALCIGLSFKIYFFNYVLAGLSQLKDNIKEKGLCSDAFKPVRRGNGIIFLETFYNLIIFISIISVRFCLLVIANLANYSMLIYGFCLYTKNDTDFGTFLIALLLGNTLVHTVFYTIMKVSK